MNILLVLLGCNVPYLLNDRIATAVKFANRFNNESVDWFLSGGIKNPAEDTVTEAEKMAAQISQYAPDNWNYIYDTVATNTAENFIMVKQYLDETPIDYSEVFVVTSEFHYDRARKIAEKIIGTTEFRWILSEAELHDSRYWEKIHIKNVDADVNKAFIRKLRFPNLS
jgi:uncharacterized SAM-binding protein YcdF (DUF218 family)